MMKRIFKNAIFLFLLSLLFPFRVHAGSASISLSGGKVIVGNNITVKISLNSIDDGTLVSFGGRISYDDNYLSLVSCASNSSLTYNGNLSNNKISFVDFSSAGISSGAIGSCTFSTKAVGSTTVSISGTEATNSTVNVSASVSNASITITNPPSGNNNLKSLSVDKGSISFNAATTSYSVNVGSDVTSVNVSAAAEDANAKVSGTGSKSLDYGKNTVNVVVTAENGDKKTYTITVNREDTRSSNNNLSSLIINKGTLSPKFGKGTTTYNVSVPFEVEKISVNAKAEDSLAKVSINSPSLVAEKTTNLTVKVTAENGSVKTYTIKVKRGKDPNKPLSNNNYLESLTIDNGELSPAFNKDVESYSVYLPFEITSIKLDAVVEDKEYATLEKDGSESLSVGNNLIKITVTAEDGSKRVYSVTVVRNKSTTEVEAKGTPYLKKIKLSKGFIIGSFNKNNNAYGYISFSKKVSIKEAIPELEEDVVKINKIKNGFVIIVEHDTGEQNFYVLVNRTIPVIIVIVVFLAMAGGIGFMLIKNKKGKKNNKNNTKE